MLKPVIFIAAVTYPVKKAPVENEASLKTIELSVIGITADPDILHGLVSEDTWYAAGKYMLFFVL